MAGMFLLTLALSFGMARMIRERRGVNHSAPVVVSTSDPELDNAVETARLNLPHFWKEFTNPDGRNFAIKVRFKTQAGPEMIWVDHIQREKNGELGQLADDSTLDSNSKKGSPVSLGDDQIVDWIIVAPDGTQEGDYTGPVLEREMAAKGR